jgi:ABC-type branched-subunit amino acid transport system substrate-binding protein
MSISERSFLSIHQRLAHALCLAGLGLVGCWAEDDLIVKDEGSVTIGLLLPFTGPSAATSVNFERAVIYATERVNQAGGVGGKSLRVVAGDTHSGVERSLAAAQRLIDIGAVIILGPEDPEIATELILAFGENDVAFVSPLIGSGADLDVDCSKPWFRLAPSAQSLGQALAKLLAEEQVVDISMMYGAGDYNVALHEAVGARFQSLGGDVLYRSQLEEGAPSYGSEVRAALSPGPGAVVLVTSPATGAAVVNDADAFTSDARWFLSPLLKTRVFLQNTAPGSLDGALGVTPRIFEAASSFPTEFAARWLGDVPLEGAHFYFDAIALVAMALARLADSGAQGSASLAAAIFESAAPPGEAVGWQEVELGLSRIREGQDMYYSGLTGPLLFTQCGARRLGQTQRWSISAGQIVD